VLELGAACATLGRTLLLHSLLLSVALGGVLALRGPVARQLGAQALRPLWAVLPAVLLALLVYPFAAPLLRPTLAPLLLALDGSVVTAPASPPLGQTAAATGSLLLPALSGCWMLGVLAVTALMVTRQRRYLRWLQPSDDPRVLRASAGSSPAQLGWRASRLVLPLDFEARFSAEEQGLVLAHEATHLAHRDNAWNLLAAVLCALHWFNPLLWWAARAWRRDQELSCDAAVLQHTPDARACYARALLKCHQPDTLSAVLAAPWRATHNTSHPLVERVRMLHTSPLASRRRAVSQWLLWPSVALCAGAALTAQAAAEGGVAPASRQVDLQLRVLVNGLPAGEPRLISAVGQAATVTLAPGAGAAPGDTAWQIETTTTELPDGKLQLSSQVRHGEPLSSWGQNSLVAAPGETRQWFVSDERGGQVIYVYQTAQLVTAGQPPLPPTPPAPPSPPSPLSAAALPVPPVPPAPPAPVAPTPEAQRTAPVGVR
jgi:beta-lactamase regulating signal transducer with metallopeptidase domain